ncbi:hypothetical protein C2S51_014977 [Perilla frutescens var. frutescens]|nr:hypothetical protein C2S51_014977 [Perilla frutescens var. frutescens]
MGQKSKCWTERKKGNVIGRISTASPIEGERYYLRLLLNHVRGPTSFQYLLTVNGREYSSFKEAAQMRGLLEADQSIVKCLNGAVTFQMPNELRRLFAIILVHWAPTDVRILWDTYFHALSEDFNREVSAFVELQVSKNLKSLRAFLESMGKDIKSYDLPDISIHIGVVDNECSREIQDELSIEIPKEDHDAELKLNVE